MINPWPSQTRALQNLIVVAHCMVLCITYTDWTIEQGLVGTESEYHVMVLLSEHYPSEPALQRSYEGGVANSHKIPMSEVRISRHDVVVRTLSQ